MATRTAPYAPELTNDQPLPVREALARVYPDYPRIGWRRPMGYQSDELYRSSVLASNHARDTGRQYARWHQPRAA